jgi:GT2 family glycosyltransferase
VRVTCVLTSCGRFDLLDKTLRSFFKFNTYPIEKFIIIDDSGYANAHAMISRTLDQLKLYESPEFLILINEKNVGQVKSINLAYAHVKTQYIFHMEDDWEFYAGGFIEESLPVLQNYPWIITVWLRAHNDTNGHPLEHIQELPFPLLTLGYASRWHGFTWNPSLRRLKNYKLIDGEAASSTYYMRKGYRAAITTKQDGYVRHIGWDSSTAHIAGTNKG